MAPPCAEQVKIHTSALRCMPELLFCAFSRSYPQNACQACTRSLESQGGRRSRKRMLPVAAPRSLLSVGRVLHANSAGSPSWAEPSKRARSWTGGVDRASCRPSRARIRRDLARSRRGTPTSQGESAPPLATSSLCAQRPCAQAAPERRDTGLARSAPSGASKTQAP